MASWEFPASTPIEAQIRIPAGEVRVRAEPTQTVTVDVEPGMGGWRGWLGSDPLSDIRVDFESGRLRVTHRRQSGFLGRSAGFDVVVRLPEGSSGEIDTAAADVRCDGTFSSLSVRTASGDVTAGHVLRSAEVQTASGDVELGQSGTVRVQTVSGDVEVGGSDADATCQSVSGDVEIGRIAAGRIDVKTTSGDITVGVVPGIRLRLDLATLSGDASSELSEDEEGSGITATLTCRSVSGDIRLRRAEGAAAA
jgi:DUF4097 and DUF4098 domain-containing protein YvlB